MARTAKTSKSSAKTAAKIAQFSAAPKSFADDLFRNVLAVDAALFSSKDRASVTNSLWAFAQGRKRGTSKVRAYNPTLENNGWTVDHTVLEIVNDDMPFLVSSITSALQLRGLSIHHIIHPVFEVTRDAKGNITKIDSGKPESVMHIQFDRCIDGEVIKKIESEITAALNDIRAAVEDWPSMRQRMKEALDQAKASLHTKTGEDDLSEAREFLNWLDDQNFTYLGYRDINLTQKDGRLTSVQVVEGSGLGILRDKETRVFGGMRSVSTQKSANLQLYVRRHEILVVTKTNMISRVHRPNALDAIFVRRFNDQGEVLGERLFLGLFTSKSYSQNPDVIPFVRRKIDFVLAHTDFAPESHNGRALIHILNNYPHDELLQISKDELLTNSLGILRLQERARVALFVRHDPFRRFITCLIYVPRERYDSKVRAKFQELLEQSFGGKAHDWNVRISESLLARIFVTVTTTPDSPQPDLAIVEHKLREMCRSWTDRLRDALTAVHGEAQALYLLNRYGESFPLAYQDNVEPVGAVADIAAMEKCAAMSKGELVVNLTQDPTSHELRLKLFRNNAPVALSDTLPLLEQAGLKIEYMGGPYEITTLGTAPNIYVHEFVGMAAHKPVVEFAATKSAFEQTMTKLWSGDMESDGLNALTLIAGMDWRSITIMRTFARYLKQLRIPYSPETIASTFQKNPVLAQKLTSLFLIRHDPALKGNRDTQFKALEQEILTLLGAIDVLEEDRIVRRFLNLVHSSLRTNFFQTNDDGAPKSYVSIKFDSRLVDFMPLPKPMYEVFVYSTRTEAIHLRGGKVARGGIRWSDRREDFRSEVLGLMKAQMVKNTVIVPLGSKGGFILKRPPAEADKMQAEGIACYRILMCGLLDITDNRVNGKIVPPKNVVRHDNDDPYLVVAADKGTAKFSDIANGISQEYKFWLDDAFASGGSVGYDHKAMGITAKGAWEAAKRHFRELGKDIQTTDFTCMGVGDMSGDVFGNGMLLSEHIALLGAFDHRHIFCDPNPDVASSHAERARMFALPRSSWDDYNKKLISKGGGVFPRSAKSIKLTTEMKKVYGVDVDSLAPAELIQAMLKANVEMLYFGGIGTYVKASSETQDEAGDRTNEALRIDGGDIRAKVVVEGANLGFTQRGRIEYAQKGGHINTDAIDNSAGVDTSDHEVNIKILLRKIVDRGNLTFDTRNKLLSSMTKDVAELVLQDNYDQTQALSLTETRAAELLPTHAQCIHFLERTGLLNRAVEFLPNDSAIAERQRLGKGLTRPELAVLMAYTKLWVYQSLLDSNLPDEATLKNDLQRYFPDALQKKYPKDITQHQLSREITATVVTNVLVNRAGSRFILPLVELGGHDITTIARAFIFARDVLDLTDTWLAIEKLDNKVSAQIQIRMLGAIEQGLISTVQWALGHPALLTKIEQSIATLQPGVRQVLAQIAVLPSHATSLSKKMEEELVAAGVPSALARTTALMGTAETALELTHLAGETKTDIKDIAAIYFAIGQRGAIDWLREHAAHIVTQTPWQKETLTHLLADIVGSQRKLTTALTRKGNKLPIGQRLQKWLESNAKELERYDVMVNEWRSANAIDMSALMLASRSLGALAGK